MIRLTLRDSANSHIYVNAFQIVWFYADTSGSIIELTKGNNLFVKENPEEIQKLIKK